MSDAIKRGIMIVNSVTFLTLIAAYGTTYYLCRDDKVTLDSTFEGRFKLAAGAVVFPCLFAVFMIMKVGS